VKKRRRGARNRNRSNGAGVRGAFLAGEDRHSETLPAFYIDRTEVPNSAMRASARPRDARSHRALPPTIRTTRWWESPSSTRRNSPSGQASAFRPRSNGEGRSRPDGRTYPWGNEADATAPTSPQRSHAGHLFATAESPFRTINMTGNVWEFADDLKTPSEQAVRSFAAILKPHRRHRAWYVIRGGSYKRRSRTA